MSDSSDDFGKLTRLMALKRHEQPPPGYFQGFSRSIIAKLEAGEASQTSSWLAEWWQSLSRGPLMLGATGALAIAFVLVITLGSHNTPPAPLGAGASVAGAPWDIHGVPPSTPENPFNDLAAAALPASSTNPVTSPGAASSPLFRPVGLRVERVGYSLENR